MKLRDKEATRQKILEAAIDVFSDKGYNNALVDDIAKVSATSKGAFYFHFPSKKAIFEALIKTLMQRLIEDVEEAIESRHGALTKIEGALDTVLTILSRHENATRLLFVEANGLGKSFDQLIYTAHAEFIGLIAKHLQAAIDDGSIHSIPVELTASAWLGAIHEVVLMALLSPEKKRLDALKQPLCELLIQSLPRKAQSVATIEASIEEN